MKLNFFSFKKKTTSQKDTMRVASASSSVKFFDFPSGNVVNQYQPNPKHEGPIRSISWSKDGNWLAITPNSGQIEVITVKDKLKPLCTVSAVDEPTCCTFHNTTKKHLAIGTRGGILIYDIKARCVKKKFATHSYVSQVAALPRDNHVVGACANGEAMMFNLTSSVASGTFKVPRSTTMTYLACCPIRRNYLGGSSSEGNVAVWDITTSKTRYFDSSHKSPITAMCFSPVNSDLLVTAALDRHCCFHDIATDKILAKVAVDNSVLSLDMSPNGRHVVMGTHDGKILVYDSRKIAEPVKSYNHHNNCSVKHVAFQKLDDGDDNSYPEEYMAFDKSDSKRGSPEIDNKNESIRLKVSGDKEHSTKIDDSFMVDMAYGDDSKLGHSMKKSRNTTAEETPNTKVKHKQGDGDRKQHRRHHHHHHHSDSKDKSPERLYQDLESDMVVRNVEVIRKSHKLKTSGRTEEVYCVAKNRDSPEEVYYTPEARKNRKTRSPPEEKSKRPCEERRHGHRTKEKAIEVSKSKETNKTKEATIEQASGDRESPKDKELNYPKSVPHVNLISPSDEESTQALEEKRCKIGKNIQFIEMYAPELSPNSRSRSIQIGTTQDNNKVQEKKPREIKKGLQPSTIALFSLTPEEDEESPKNVKDLVKESVELFTETPSTLKPEEKEDNTEEAEKSPKCNIEESETEEIDKDEEEEVEEVEEEGEGEEDAEENNKAEAEIEEPELLEDEQSIECNECEQCLECEEIQDDLMEQGAADILEKKTKEKIIKESANHFVNILLNDRKNEFLLPLTESEDLEDEPPLKSKISTGSTSSSSRGFIEGTPSLSSTKLRKDKPFIPRQFMKNTPSIGKKARHSEDKNPRKSQGERNPATVSSTPNYLEEDNFLDPIFSPIFAESTATRKEFKEIMEIIHRKLQETVKYTFREEFNAALKNFYYGDSDFRQSVHDIVEEIFTEKLDAAVAECKNHSDLNHFETKQEVRKVYYNLHVLTTNRMEAIEEYINDTKLERIGDSEGLYEENFALKDKLIKLELELAELKVQNQNYKMRIQQLEISKYATEY